MSQPSQLAPLLPPLLDDATASLIKSPEKFIELIRAHGSPLNIVQPQHAEANAAEFEKTLEKHGLRGEVYYAHKANRSDSFIRQLSTTSAKLDVASLGELQHGLSNGYHPDEIMVTGPKDQDLLWLAAKLGTIINCDSLEEAERLSHIISQGGFEDCDVLIRLSGFTRAGTAALSRNSRFGEHIDALPTIAATFNKLTNLNLIGVSFHLDTIAVSEKATALERCIDAVTQLNQHGLHVDVIDCGGGYGTTYVDTEESWHAFTEALTDATRGARPSITWNRHTYGLRAEQGVVRGAVGLYPASRKVTGARYLDECLSQVITNGQSIAQTLSDHLIELWVEPGRAMLANAGFTLARVVGVRDEQRGTLVQCAMNARDVSLEEHGVAVDPVLLTADQTTTEPCQVYLLGNLCLEADMITKRAITLPRKPQPGDVLLFANTAGYFMDFSADSALHQPIAKTLSIYENNNSHTGGFSWCEDKHYWPFCIAPATSTTKVNS